MGCGNSTIEQLESKEIDKMLIKSREMLKKELKILILGTGASGKTTIVKQLRIIHLSGYSQQERALFKEFIQYNILNSMKALVIGSQKFGYEIQGNKEIIEELINMTLQLEHISLDEDRGQKIRKLWETEGIQKTYLHANQLQIDDGAYYFINKIDEISKKDYCPTIDDILNVRIKSTGLKEIQFTHKSYSFRVVDVGGQRSERKKWIHCFQDVTAILFVVALNDYERVLEEDLKTNRLRESIDLFEQVINNKWFAETNIILFLNKKDIFQKRVGLSHLSNFFDEYKGKNEYGPAFDFIKDQFQNSDSNEDKRGIYFHETCATDTDNIKFVWNAVHDILLNKNFENFY
eukprot:TRINITY_DN1666_c0_g1_i1.p1 TRINITY_DN1666_c0_g1~~TRINITY_DN1666_c0_g1_i1.p1  ORF type:complete len:348 (+),score=57.67 TRINITY_DN1666_c0_g1_i1:39-1082(+)